MSNYIKGNKFLKAITVNADALNMYGDPVGDGSWTIDGLSVLSNEEAVQLYNQVKELCERAKQRCTEINKHNEIVELEKKLKELKGGSDE